MASRKALKFTQTALTAGVKTLSNLIDATLLSGGSLVATVDFFLLQAEAQSIRWTEDGTDPTASVGHVLTAGQSLVLGRESFGQFKCILVTAGAITNVTAYKGTPPVQMLV